LACAQAPNNGWLGGDGDWGIDSNWSLGHIPSSQQNTQTGGNLLENCVIPAAAVMSGPTLSSGESGICSNLTVGANRWVNLDTGSLDVEGNSIVNSGVIYISSSNGLRILPPQGGPSF
jgi:hypothetical protein